MKKLLSLIIGLFTLLPLCAQVAYAPAKTATATMTEYKETHDAATICPNELPYIWRGKSLETAGVFTDTLVSSSGLRDSILFLHLNVTVLPEMLIPSDTTIHAGESVLLWATGVDQVQWAPSTGLVQRDGKTYAEPTTTITYTATGTSKQGSTAGNLVYNGGFELGNVGFVSGLTYRPGYTPMGSYGDYTVNDAVNKFWESSSAPDAATAPAYGGSGMMMIVDGATKANAVVWQQTVDVTPHTYYIFSAQVMSCLASNKHGKYALLQFSVNNKQLGEVFHSPTELYQWARYYEVWYSGENTTATLTILNQNTDSQGNDFAMDDIRFEPQAKACAVQKTITITVQEKCPTPKPDLSVRADTAIHKGSSVKMWAEGADVVRWSPETDLTKDADGVLYAQPEQTTIYTATGYNLQPDAGNSVVVNGDFEDGNTGFTTSMHYIAPRPGTGGWVSWGEYTVTDEVGSFWDTPDVGYAYGGSGQMMVIDGATTANSIIWQQTVPVMPHTYYAFSTQVMSCLISNQTGHYALLQFSVNNEQLGEVFHSPTELYQWARYYEVWYSGENTSALLTILNQNTDGLGNDFAIDAVHFEPLTPGCEAVKTVTITVLKECSKDSTFLKPVICVNDLPYTHPETGVIYYEDAVSRRDIISEKDQYGCDSIIVVDMTILPQPTGDTTAYFYASRPFAWHDTTYAIAGDYPYLYPSERAPVCDSLVTLHLIEKTDCAPMEATVQVSDICADAKTMPVEIRLMSEEIGEMTLQFTNAPLNTMPFRDTTIVIDNYTSGQTMTIEVEVPQDAMDITRYPRPDEYTLQIVLRDYCNNVKAMDKQTFTVLYPSWITEQHWDDVIAIVNDKHNGGYTFSQVAWLRDGGVISGEEKLYLYLPHDLWTDEDHQTQSDHQYQALLTRSDDGKTVLSCPITPRRINNTDMMTGNKPYVDVTPTRVPVAYPTVHIMTNTTGTYQVMNMAGTVLQRQDYKPCEHGAMDITLPNSSGMYMIVFMPKDADKPLQDKYRVVRIIVE